MDPKDHAGGNFRIKESRLLRHHFSLASHPENIIRRERIEVESDLPPALTLSAQILASTLFGVLGLALADPIVAMIKVALERESERAARDSRIRQQTRLLGIRPPPIRMPQRRGPRE